MTRKEMNRLQIPGLTIKKDSEIEHFTSPRKTRDGIYVTDYPSKLGIIDNVTLHYVQEWEVAYHNGKAYVWGNNYKTIVYKFLTQEYITNILMASLNDFNKCVKQMKAFNKKQELEKDFYEQKSFIFNEETIKFYTGSGGAGGKCGFFGYISFKSLMQA